MNHVEPLNHVYKIRLMNHLSLLGVEYKALFVLSRIRGEKHNRVLSTICDLICKKGTTSVKTFDICDLTFEQTTVKKSQTSQFFIHTVGTYA